MAVKFGVNLANGELIGTSNTTLYTAPSTVDRVAINQARVINTAAGPAILSLYILQPGDVIADNFKAVDVGPVAAGETLLLSEIIGDSLLAGGTIVGISDTVTALSFSATGTEFSA